MGEIAPPPELDLKKLPRHVAIIMDGNGRWAERRHLPRVAGHKEGINSLKAVLKVCEKIKLRVLTLYTFSLENWGRPQAEVNFLMNLLLEHLKHEKFSLKERGIKLRVIGELSLLPSELQKEIEDAVRITADNKDFILTLAISYGGRQEIITAVRKIAAEVYQGKLKLSEITESLFSRYLFTHELPEPDLLIRTAGENRVSNFLLWQIAYTEFYITSVCWPDFREQEFYLALVEYQKRKRKFGKLG
jgi:undecaprenyl diphosphate synthase